MEVHVAVEALAMGSGPKTGSNIGYQVTWTNGPHRVPRNDHYSQQQTIPVLQLLGTHDLTMKPPGKTWYHQWCCSLKVASFTINHSSKSSIPCRTDRILETWMAGMRWNGINSCSFTSEIKMKSNNPYQFFFFLFGINKTLSQDAVMAAKPRSDACSETVGNHTYGGFLERGGYHHKIYQTIFFCFPCMYVYIYI